MFSSICGEKESSLPAQQELGCGSIQVMVASARPLMHVRRPPSPPIELPSISLHLDRHKIMSTLSATGISLELTALPMFTRNAISTAFDENGGPPDILVLSGSGTSWDDAHLIVEDGFGSADFVELVDLKLVIPEQPKLMIAVGSYCERFCQFAIEEGVSPLLLVLDDVGVGAQYGYQAVATILRELLEMEGLKSASDLQKIFENVSLKFGKQGLAPDNLRLYTAHSAVAPVIPLKLFPGTCRVQDTHSIASLRAKQSWRVFRQLAFEGRSPSMWKIINAIERNCSHTVVLLHGESGCGRTELAAQVMLWYLDRAKLTCALWGNCDEQSDLVHQVRTPTQPVPTGPTVGMAAWGDEASHAWS